MTTYGPRSLRVGDRAISPKKLLTISLIYSFDSTVDLASLQCLNVLIFSYSKMNDRINQPISSEDDASGAASEREINVDNSSGSNRTTGITRSISSSDISLFNSFAFYDGQSIPFLRTSLRVFIELLAFCFPFRDGYATVSTEDSRPIEADATPMDEIPWAEAEVWTNGPFDEATRESWDDDAVLLESDHPLAERQGVQPIPSQENPQDGTQIQDNENIENEITIMESDEEFDGVWATDAVRLS